MSTQCASPIKGDRARFTTLDQCGAPVTGAGNVVTTDGFVQIQYAFTYRDGAEYEAKKANGSYCVDQQGAPKLRWIETTIDFCQVNPSILGMIGGFDLLTTAGDVTGFQIGEDLVVDRFGLEVWQEVAGEDACAGGLVASYYWVLPNLGNAKVGNYTVEDGAATFQVVAQTRAASSAWGNGPHSDGPWVPQSITGHIAGNYTTASPLPAIGCDPVAL
jgi:hypothetical protein